MSCTKLKKKCFEIQFSSTKSLENQPKIDLFLALIRNNNDFLVHFLGSVCVNKQEPYIYSYI